MLETRFRTAAVLPLLLATVQAAAGQARVTAPDEQFGHPIGADFVLPDYTAFTAYWQKLAAESDRMVLDTIGTTAEGRPQLMAIITSPANHRNLDRFREISRRLALADGVSDEEARQLAGEGRAVVWIDGGLHATEVLGAQQLMETVYQLLSRTDAETLRILDDVIILAVHANPDGMELVSDWYMRESDPAERRTSGIPRLYQKYVGHDNNRDFYASVQPETENMNRVMYTEWFPQIVYNHHQTGPAGTVMFAPPFRDPVNHNYDPLIPVSIDMVGAAMHDRFIREDKPGVTMRSGANYSTWWNGGLRTMPYFHNMIGLLTETIGNPTPMEIPFIPRRQIPHGDLPAPIEPQAWHFRQSIDYSVTANYAVLDIASRRRDTFLYNIWKMGSNSIERGSTDTWTHYPRHVARAAEQLAAARNGAADEDGSDAMNARGTREQFDRLLRDPALRDARGYILTADQPDFLTAAKFIDALLETGVQVHRATAPFTVNAKQYPAGSYVVKTAQAFRPHVIDMFEPQDHPDDIPYPGGPPTPPYDNAGWTLAYQMGVQFDRILDGFGGPFERIEGLRAPRPAGGIAGSGNAGLLLSAAANDAFLAVNRLLAAGHDVYRLKTPQRVGSATWPAGTFYIRQRGSARADAERIARETGLTFTATGARPGGEHTRLRPIRIALWDRYGGSMPSGWTRWILEQFAFPFEVVYPQTLDAGDLAEKYDALILVTGAVPPVRPAARGPGGGGGQGGGDDADVPEEFRHMTGSITAERTVPQLRAFLEGGGSIITIGSSTNLAQHLGLPVSDALVETVDGGERPLPRSKYYVPGSILEVRVDTTLAVAYGLPGNVDVMFDNSPVMKVEPGASGIRPIAWFDSPAPLRSGWAWGESVLQGGVAMAEADVGEGRLFLFGPEVLFRAQPHGTFRFVFNSLYTTAGEDSRIR
ncbi:MAG TPA: M14 metallopeptidase family protein [Longimicrobiales bacterium]